MKEPQESLVTVIVPAYNAGRYLDECLNSVRQQTYRDIEIIVVDDGSADGTAEILAAHCREDSRVRAVWQPNSGASVARNRGVLLSRGEYLSFFDADDIMLPHSIASRLHAINWPTPVGAVYADHLVVDADRRPITVSRGIEMSSRPILDLLVCPCMGIQGVLLRRGELARAGLFDPFITHVEDWDLWIRLADAGTTFRRLPGVMDEYRRHDSNITRSYDLMLLRGLAMLQKHRPAIGDLPRRRAWRKGRRGLMRGWIWSLWSEQRSILLKITKLARHCLRHPTMVLVLISVVLGSLEKRFSKGHDNPRGPGAAGDAVLPPGSARASITAEMAE
jgi:glycosyltransferase involved in cell wall biosynthesis